MTQTAQKNCRRSLRNVTARIEGNLPANSIAEPGAKKGLCASRAGDLPLAPALALHKTVPGIHNPRQLNARRICATVPRRLLPQATHTVALGGADGCCCWPALLDAAAGLEPGGFASSSLSAASKTFWNSRRKSAVIGALGASPRGTPHSELAFGLL